MADIKKLCDIGEIRPDPRATSASFEWLIPNFFELSQDPDCVVCSPVFSFQDAEWCLNFCPNGFTETNSVGWIALGLGKLHSDTASHRVSFKITFRKKDGTEFVCCSGEENFVGDGSLSRAPFFEKRSRIVRRRSEIAHDGALVLSCTLRAHSADATSVAACQSDAVRSTDEYTQIGRNFPYDDSMNVPEEIEGDVFVKDTSGNPEGKDEYTQTEGNFTFDDSMNVPEKIGDGVFIKDTSGNAEGPSKLIEDFRDFLVSREHSDAIIKVRNREFRVHKLILAARSRYFADKFRRNVTEGSSTEVMDISQCDPDAFQELLLYLYSGQIEKISEENVLDLCDVGYKFDVEEIRSECIKFLRKGLSVNNLCDIIELAVKHNDSELMAAATDFFVRNISEIIETDKWKNFLKKYPAESGELYATAVKHLKR